MRRGGTEVANGSAEERTPEEEMGRLHQGWPESRCVKLSERTGQDAAEEETIP